MKKFAMVLCCLFFYCPLWANIIHVPGDQATIQAGINAAVDGDTVLVADNTYIENINFLGKAITVASHFIMNGDTSHIANTIIDGSQPSNPDSGSVVYFISGEDTTSVLMGFTITGGSGTLSEYSLQGAVIQTRIGGGILGYFSGGKIVHNHIRDNHIPLYNEAAGGGIAYFPYGGYSANTIIEDNRIINNSITGVNYSWGGAIALNNSGRIKDNFIAYNASTVTENDAVSWGAVVCSAQDSLPQSVLIEYNQIVYNTADGFYANAGAITIEYGMNALITENLIADNVVTPGSGGSGGGGLLIAVTSGTIEIEKNRIERNRLDIPGPGAGGGGGIRLWTTEAGTNNNIFIHNNIFVANEAPWGGGLASWNSYSEIINNTFVNNISYGSGGGIAFEASISPPATKVHNNILWGNTATSGSQIRIVGTAAAEVNYCNVEGGWSGVGNIYAEPHFEDDTYYYLANNSPCIDAGDSDMVYNDPEDPLNPGFARWPAMGTLRNDMGAYGGMGSDTLMVGIKALPSPTGNLPSAFQLFQNYPNPFNPSTTIEFDLAKPARVTLNIYNTLGQEVAELFTGKLATGRYQYNWNAAGLASGVYYYQLETDNRFIQTKKMLLIR